MTKSTGGGQFVRLGPDEVVPLSKYEGKDKPKDKPKKGKDKDKAEAVE